MPLQTIVLEVAEVQCGRCGLMVPYEATAARLEGHAWKATSWQKPDGWGHLRIELDPGLSVDLCPGCSRRIERLLFGKAVS
jgi:hypothetical protein